MRKVLSLVFLFALLVAFSYTQEFGAMRGTVRDTEGNPLPGVTVTLTGPKTPEQTTVTSAGGNFRFLGLPGGSNYTIKFELEGFKTEIREKQVISFGRDNTYDIRMQMAALEESVTVIGQSPVIDTKRTQVGINVTEEMIMSLPTARNPWVIMSLIPGMLVDREDVGGNEGGQQSSYYGHGGGRGDQTWNIDGANITDNSALGAAPSYLNIASYDELQINYGNNDVKSQTGGVQVNLVSKRGGNAFSGTFYLDAEDKRWQADNVKGELKDIGYTAAGVDRVYLYGVNFGGPVIRDRAWFYLAYGIQDINATTLAATTDKTWLVSGYAKMNFQLTRSTRMEGFLEYDNKEKFGRTQWDATQQGPETVWNQTGPGYLWKGEIDQTFGNLYLNLKGIFTNGGFNLQPIQGVRTSDGSGQYETVYNYPEFYAAGNIDDYGTDRDQLNVNLSGNLFLEDVLGADHEWKFGVDYVTSTVTTFDLYEGNLRLNYYGPDETLPLGEWWEAWLMRDYSINYGFKRYSLFLQDTASFGRFAVNLGVRYDVESSVVNEYTIPASPWLPQYMQQLSVSEIDPGVKWKTLSPRLSVVWDIFGTGKDIFKLSIARYGSQSGFGLADFINPVGWTEVDVIWQDFNGDGRVTNSELFGYDWDTGELKDVNDPNYWLWYGGFDADNPTSLSLRNKYASDYNSPLLDELTASYEKELFADFAARLEFFYKKQHNEEWTKRMLPDGTIEDSSNYYLAGTAPEVNYEYYGRTSFYPNQYRLNYPNRYTQYLAGQIVFTKRLSNKWMMDASFTYSDWKQHYKGDIVDPTNIEYYDGGVVAPGSGGSGLTGIYVNSRWMGKLSGLVQFPYGINFSSVIVAREGYVKLTDVRVYRPGIGYGSIYGSPGGGGKFGDERLPTFWVINFRLEKLFQIGDAATVALGIDAFNVTNSAHALKQETRITSDNFGRDLRILNPRVFRFGARFSF
ncbi:MAG: carboxypeptidase regulatory-like domain-containing protein [Candidatus Aminicenantales bacterium]